MDVIPSIYMEEYVGGNNGGGLLPEENVKLRYGEVKREILPSDKGSVSKKWREYDVLVQHREGGSATHRIYYNCMVLNSLCGGADYVSTSLRASDKKTFELGAGSRVFVLCVEGNDARGVIIGGPQQHIDTSNGRHHEIEFNGVNFQVGNDGSWVLTNKGKTDINGQMDSEADKDGAGTLVKVEANGNFVVSTQGGKNVIAINHKDGTIVVNSSNKVEVNSSVVEVNSDTAKIDSNSVTIDSPNVAVGSNAFNHAVLGEQLAAILAQVFGVIGPTLPSPYQQAAVAAATLQLSTILSGSVRVGK